MSVLVVVFVVLFCYEGCSGLGFHVMKESESNSKTQNKLEFNFRPNTWQKRTNCARAKVRDIKETAKKWWEAKCMRTIKIKD